MAAARLGSAAEARPALVRGPEGRERRGERREWGKSGPAWPGARRGGGAAWERRRARRREERGGGEKKGVQGPPRPLGQWREEVRQPAGPGCTGREEKDWAGPKAKGQPAFLLSFF